MTERRRRRRKKRGQIIGKGEGERGERIQPMREGGGKKRRREQKNKNDDRG